MKNIIATLPQFCILSISLSLAACSGSGFGDMQAIIGGGIDQSNYRIELSSNGVASSSVADAAIVKVYAVNAIGAPAKDFVPTLNVTGDGVNTATCAPLGYDHSECKIISDRSGEKIVSISGIATNKAIPVIFTEPTDMLTVNKMNNSALANGTDSITFEFVLKNKNGNPRVGVHPQAQMLDNDKAIVNCSPSDSSGKAYCKVRSLQPGTYKLKSTLLTATPLSMTFVAPKIQVLTHGDATPQPSTGSEAVLKIPAENGVVPTLELIPQDADFTCEPAAEGFATCKVTSPNVGSTIVRVTNPTSISDEIEVIFANKDNNIAPAPNMPSSPKANGSTAYEFVVEMPNQDGQTPTVDVIGSGNNQVICQPATDGKSICQMTSNSPGEKEIVVKSPPTRETLKVQFASASLVKDNPARADGMSPVKIFVPMGSNIGSKPDVSITKSPVEAHHEITCTPSLFSSDLGQTVSLCLVTASEPGSYTIAITSPNSENFEIVFTDDKSSLEFEAPTSSVETADGGEVRVVVTLKNSSGAPKSGVTPVLKITGSGQHSVSCNPSDSNGQSVCAITNSIPGIKYITVESPRLATQLAAQFTASGAKFDKTNVNQKLDAVTASESMGIIFVNIGENSAGTIPSLSASGIGNITTRCEPTNSSGIAKCKIQGDTPSEVKLSILEPVSKDTLTLTIHSNVRSCSFVNATSAVETWSGQNSNDYNTWSTCTVISCSTNRTNFNNSCIANTRDCKPMPVGAQTCKQTWDFNVENWGTPIASSCESGYVLIGASCVLEDTEPDSLAGQITSLSNVPLNTETTEEITINGINKPVSMSVVAKEGIATQSGAVKIQSFNSATNSWVDRGTSYDGIINGDTLRIVLTSSNTVTTTRTVEFAVGSSQTYYWNVETSSRISPNTPVLSHTANLNTFSVSWGSGGVGNGQCLIQYLKDGTTWTSLANFQQNCDASLGNTTVTLPGNGWTNNFSAGVNVRLVRVENTNDVVLDFSEKITCLTDSQILTSDSNNNRDSNCNGSWNDDFDNTPPTGGSITSTHIGTTGTAITLSITSSNDDIAGMSTTHSDYLLEVKTATLTNGVCGSFNAYADASVTETAESTDYTYNGVAGNCYMFRYRVKDKAGNTTLYETAQALKIYYVLTPSVLSITGLTVTGPISPSYSAPSDIIFTNTSEGNLTLQTPAISLSGTNPGNFEVVMDGSTTCANALVLAPGSSCTVRIRAQASADATFSGLLNMHYDSTP